MNKVTIVPKDPDIAKLAILYLEKIELLNEGERNLVMIVLERALYPGLIKPKIMKPGEWREVKR